MTYTEVIDMSSFLKYVTELIDTNCVYHLDDDATDVFDDVEVATQLNANCLRIDELGYAELYFEIITKDDV